MQRSVCFVLTYEEKEKDSIYYFIKYSTSKIIYPYAIAVHNKNRFIY